MTDDACQRYMEDPEANAAHLLTCAECRAVDAALGVRADAEPAAVDLDSLPLAPWEGSSHRPWPFVLGGTAVVITIALALCDAAGTSPIHVAEGSLVSVEKGQGLLRNATEWLSAASIGVQVAFGAGFVLVNALLVFLLRRAPRGIDA